MPAGAPQPPVEARARGSGGGLLEAFSLVAGERAFADNFDRVGLVRDVARNLSSPMKGWRVVVMGAGGAARGARLPLIEQRPADWWWRTVPSPRPRRSASSTGGYPDLGTQSFDILLHLLHLAREAAKGRLADGTGMLVEQAAEGFAWWRGVRPASARWSTDSRCPSPEAKPPEGPAAAQARGSAFPPVSLRPYPEGAPGLGGAAVGVPSAGHARSRRGERVAWASP